MCPRGCAVPEPSLPPMPLLALCGRSGLVFLVLVFLFFGCFLILFSNVRSFCVPFLYFTTDCANPRGLCCSGGSLGACWSLGGHKALRSPIGQTPGQFELPRAQKQWTEPPACARDLHPSAVTGGGQWWARGVAQVYQQTCPAGQVVAKCLLGISELVFQLHLSVIVNLEV